MKRRLLGVSIGWLGIGMIADGVPSVLLPHRLLSMGQADATTLGIVTLGALALAALVQPFAGALSDQLGRWPVVAGGTLASMVGLVLLVAPETMVIGAVLVMVGISAAQAGYQPLLPESVPFERRGRAAGFKSAFDIGGATLGFLLLAMLLMDGHTAAAAGLLVVVLAAAFLIAFGLLVGQGDRRPPGIPAARLRVRDLLNNLPRGLVQIVAARFLFLLGIFAVGRFLLFFVGDRLALDADTAAAYAGLALGVLALATVAASVPSGWLADRLGRRALMFAGGWCAALGIGLLPAANSLELILGMGLLMALGSAAFSVSSWAALADLAASADAGRLLALANLGTAGAAAGAGAFGVLIDAGNAASAQLGYVVGFALAALLAFGGGVLAWRASGSSATSQLPHLVEVPD